MFSEGHLILEGKRHHTDPRYGTIDRQRCCEPDLYGYGKSMTRFLTGDTCVRKRRLLSLQQSFTATCTSVASSPTNSEILEQTRADLLQGRRGFIVPSDRRRDDWRELAMRSPAAAMTQIGQGTFLDQPSQPSRTRRRCGERQESAIRSNPSQHLAMLKRPI